MIELLYALKKNYHIIGIDPFLDDISLEIYKQKMKNEKADISSLFSGFLTSASHVKKTTILDNKNEKRIILHDFANPRCKHYIYLFEHDEIVNKWFSTSQDLVDQLENKMNLDIKLISKRSWDTEKLKKYLNANKVLVKQSNRKNSCFCCTS